jgi:hypothetical protein
MRWMMLTMGGMHLPTSHQIVGCCPSSLVGRASPETGVGVEVGV